MIAFSQLWLHPEMDLKLIHEISHVSSYLASRSDASSTCASGVELADKLARAMAHQVQQLAFVDASAAARLAEAVNTSGYTQAGKDMVGAAIDVQVTRSICDKPCNAKSSKPHGSQRLHEHMPKYFTSTENTKLLCKTASYDNKQQVVIDRLKLIGLEHTDQLTMAFAVALLTIHHDDNMPSFKSMHARFADFKVAFKASTRIWPFGVIEEYPASPNALPDEVRQHAYTDEPPSGCEVPRLKLVATKQIPMRGNSKLLRQSKSGKRKRNNAAPRALRHRRTAIRRKSTSANVLNQSRATAPQVHLRMRSFIGKHRKRSRTRSSLQ